MIKIYNLHHSRIVPILSAFIAFLWMLGVLNGCFANHGRLKLSRDVRYAFENFQTFKNHRYYYSGRKSKPLAIIAVYHDYRFESKNWTEINLQKTDLEELIKRLYPYYYSPPYGYYILDPNGKKAGLWFSEFRHTAIRLENDNSLVVATPEPVHIYYYRRLVPDMEKD